MAASPPSNVIIRSAVKSDCPEIYRLIKELAVYEKMANGVKISQETLEKDGFETSPPMWRAFVAEIQNEDGKLSLVGYALYFEFYSLLKGKSFWLRDLYIEENWRQHKLGQTLLENVVRTGVEMNCSQIDWFCLSWNPARNFYEKLNAKNITETEDWHVYRMDKDVMLQTVAKQKTIN